MTSEEAWEIYEAGKGKNGRPKKEFTEAEAHLLKTGELNPIIDDTQKKNEDKKPALLMNVVMDPHKLTHARKVEIYREGLRYITDKRNFSFRYYLTGQYGLTNNDLDQWELESEELKRIATIAYDHCEHKCIDALSDKWSGGNPIGIMMVMKAVYGYNDRGDSGALKAEGTINIVADVEESDFIDMGYDDAED